MKNIFNTDYYQIAMVYAMIMDNKANTITGYEGFVRNIKSAVNPNQNFYIFEGETEVKDFIKKIKRELKRSKLKEIFISLVKPKIEYDRWEQEFSEKFDNLITDFEFSIVKNNSKVFPFVPVFQFRGPAWIGQLIETPITNIYNGKTGLATIRYMKDNGIYITNRDLMYLESVVYDKDSEDYKHYIRDIEDRAKEFKRADTKDFLVEAAFRRAPSKGIANIASQKALENGWKATSNVSILNEKNENQINGTMAHAFVMSYKREIDSFRAWTKYFPKTTILIDTYDTISAVKKLILNSEKISDFDIRITNFEFNNALKPKNVRIDSGDFFTIVQEVRDVLDRAGWNDVEIFISGDITPEILTKLQINKVPFNKAMAGTYYVYCNELIKKVNAGFVYKLVEYRDENNILVYPEKKAEGKKNYSGLKSINMDKDNNFIISKNINKLNLENTLKFNENSKFSFNI